MRGPLAHAPADSHSLAPGGHPSGVGGACAGCSHDSWVRPDGTAGTYPAGGAWRQPPGTAGSKWGPASRVTSRAPRGRSRFSSAPFIPRRRSARCSSASARTNKAAQHGHGLTRCAAMLPGRHPASSEQPRAQHDAQKYSPSASRNAAEGVASRVAHHARHKLHSLLTSRRATFRRRIHQ